MLQQRKRWGKSCSPGLLENMAGRKEEEENGWHRKALQRKAVFRYSSKILLASPGCPCIEEMDHASNMTLSQLSFFYLTSCRPALLQECPLQMAIQLLADFSFRHSLHSSTCLYSAQQEQLHVSHPLPHPSDQSCLSKRSFETLSAVEAVAAAFQPQSLHATLQPLYLALRPLCSNWSSSFPQKQFQGLLSCAVVVTISSVDTSCYDFHTLVYFLSFMFLLWYHECCHLCFLNSTEYSHYKNQLCLDRVACFLIYLHFIIFSTFFAPLMMLFPFNVCGFFTYATLFLFILSTFPVCSCNLFAFDFYSYLSLHLITLFAQLNTGKFFCIAALFAQPACLPGKRKKYYDSTKISTEFFAFHTW